VKDTGQTFIGQKATIVLQNAEQIRDYRKLEGITGEPIFWVGGTRPALCHGFQQLAIALSLFVR
jgi:hypothetical protein